MSLSTSATDPTHPDAPFRHGSLAGSTARRAFSLIELLVVLAVTTILASLLFPALGGVRETANRMACATNMRQIGLGITMWGDDHNGALPESYFGRKEVGMPQEMMATTIGTTAGDWEGLGWLVAQHYLDSPSCLYCPSHTGEHHFGRYVAQYAWPEAARVYCNYHYAGDRDSRSDMRRRLTNNHETMLLTDGLRTRDDFNHRRGANVLHGDLAVIWFEDINGEVRALLPPTEISQIQQPPTYDTVWGLIDSKAR